MRPFMQTLWNRIVQTKYACNCSSCFSSAASCTRRTTTAIFRSRISSRDRFVVLYSSFLTAATLIDSEIKGKKREKLLGAIEDARGELKALDASQNRRLAALSIEYDDIKESALSGQRTWEDVLNWAKQEKRVRHALGFKDWKGIPLTILEGFSTEQLKYAFHGDGNLRKLLIGADPGVQTPICSMKKQKIMEWSNAKLAYRFSREIYQRKILSDLENVSEGTYKIELPLLANTVQANAMITKLKALPPDSADIGKASTPPAPKYIINHRLNKEEVVMLNSSLDEVFRFRRAQGKGLQYLLEKLSHLLLTSNTPPTTETYILLARNFDELREYRLVQLVLDAVSECNLWHDKEALTFCLDYYAKTNNLKDFQRLVRRMHTFGSDLGPALKNDMIPGSAVDKYRFGELEIGPTPKPSNRKDFTTFNSKLFTLKYQDFKIMFIRAAHKDQGVYASLIRGTLKFAGNEKAMCSYVDLIREGHEPTVEILTAILHGCCDQQDWRSGLRVLQKIRTLGEANLQTYQLLLRLCHKCQDVQRFKKLLAVGIRRGIITPAVQYFPEEIEEMEADLLLDLAREYDELIRRVKDEEISSEPPERLARWLGVINDQMAQTAFEFGFLTLSCGLSPTKGFFLYTRIEYHRGNLLSWVARGRNQSSQISNDILDVSSRTPNALTDALSGTHEVLPKVKPPIFLEAVPDSKQPISIRQRGKHAFLWYPLLRLLVHEFRKMRSRLRKLAQELGDIELSIRHGPTVGHMLHANIVLLQIRPLNPAEWTRRKPENLAYQEKLPDGKRCLLEQERDERPHNETMWETPGFGKAPNEANEVKSHKGEPRPTEWKQEQELLNKTQWQTPGFGKTVGKGREGERFPRGLKNFLPKALPIENSMYT